MILDRPHTTVVLAMSADGKLSDRDRAPVHFSSSADLAHLEQQISLVDGVVFGGTTLRADGATLPITKPELLKERAQRGQIPQPIHLICSRRPQFNPDLRFFRQPIPRWLLTTKEGAKLWQEGEQFAKILIGEKPDDPLEIDWIPVFQQLYQQGIKKLAILGGGEIVASLFAVDLIDELWLTVCPLIFGGTTAPTPVDGLGFSSAQAKHLKLLSAQAIEQDVFLHYQVYPQGSDPRS